MQKEDFYSELKKLEDKFENMNPEFEVTVRDPDLGVEGHVIVWNTGVSVGGELERCGKGGTRIKPDLTIDEIRMLSRRMALKNAASGLPLGGAKSGLMADPDHPDIEQKYRKFVSLCKPFLFENGGVFGGFGWDIGARPAMVNWACDELGSTRSFTGKPVDMGGTDYDVEGVAGLGVAVAAKIAMKYDGNMADGVTFAVQGIGAMGAAVIKYFSQDGGKLRSVADPRIGGTWILNDVCADLISSLSVGDIDKTNELLKSKGHEHFSDDCQDVLYQAVDIMMPCAVQDVLSNDNAARVQAKYISEGANGPCSDEAHTALHEQGVTVVPDFIANPGGIIAAYVELISKVTPEENAKTRINVTNAKNMTIERITDNVNKLMKLVRDIGVEPSHAGMYMALTNMFEQK